MKDGIGKVLRDLFVALVVAGVLSGWNLKTMWQDQKVLAGGVLLVAVIVVYVSIMVWRSQWPRLRRFLGRWIAMFLLEGFSDVEGGFTADLTMEDTHPHIKAACLNAKLTFSGLRLWAQQMSDRTKDDTLWNWVTNQILVAQQRYAFSISCIAFQRHGKELQTLLIERKFQGFGDQLVWLWPGSRYRGTINGDVLAELRQIVREATNCQIDFINWYGSPLTGYEETVPTHQLRGQASRENRLVVSPLFVMVQNRTQTAGIPGHIDLIYLARILDSSGPLTDNARLFPVEEVKNLETVRFWPDTRECVRRAAEVYQQYEDRAQHAHSVG